MLYAMSILVKNVKQLNLYSLLLPCSFPTQGDPNGIFSSGPPKGTPPDPPPPIHTAVDTIETQIVI